MIDYLKIAQAIKFYEDKGFKTLEVPWVAPSEIINITLPKGCVSFSCELGYLVGSAEQSFLSLVKNKALFGSYQASTPCFRNDQEDDLHQKYFFKNELFDNSKITNNRLFEVISFSEKFFSQFLPVEVIKLAPKTYDIVSKKNHIELGSYGIREHKDVGAWVFGTGCAEPRLSFVINKERE